MRQTSRSRSGNGSGGRKVVRGGLDGYTEMPEYDKDNDAVTNLLPGAGVEYTVPAGAMVHTIFNLEIERPVYCPVKQCLM